MEEDLLALLRGDSGVAALLADRVHWLLRPQSQADYPAITLSKISAPEDYHLTGPSNFAEARVQVDIWALSFTDLTAVARALKVAVQAVPYGCMQGIFIAGVHDLTDSTTPTIVFHQAIDLMIPHASS